MAYALKWDQDTERKYETGVKNCALYVYDTEQKAYSEGKAWNGITGITESPSGAEETALYADDAKYLSLRSAEELGGTIEAYMYPDEWAACDGSVVMSGMKIGQQPRKKFALAYVTTVGNDDQANAFGEKLHIIYNATASTSERAYATINDSPEAITFSWEFSTVPIDVEIDGVLNKASMVTLDSTDPTMPEGKYEKVKEALFGKEGASGDGAKPTLKTPKEIYAILQAVG